MADESFILVSLNEQKAKKLAQVISNETSRKILNLLSKEEMSESDISKALNLPMSTVHYNLKHLKEARLVQVDEFHYSEKGREVDHYKLAKKFVIIAPEDSTLESVKDKLKNILPVALICAAGAGFVHLFTKGISFMSNQASIAADAAPALMRSMPAPSPEAVSTGIVEVAEAAPVVAEAMKSAAPQLLSAGADSALTEVVNEGAMAVAEEVAMDVPQAVLGGGSFGPVSPEPLAYAVQAEPVNAALWFIIGAVFAITLYLLVDYIRKKIRQRND